MELRQNILKKWSKTIMPVFLKDFILSISEEEAEELFQYCRESAYVAEDIQDLLVRNFRLIFLDDEEQ